MIKHSIGLEYAEPGMQMAETIFNSYGAVIVAEGTYLDEHVINKLRRLDIERIRIFRATNQDVFEHGNEAFRAEYHEHVNMVRDMFAVVGAGAPVDMGATMEVRDEIIERGKENRDIISCLNSIRTVDEYTYAHSVNVSFIAMMIGKWMNLPEVQVKELVHAGLLHDMGKCRVPNQILNKPGPLSETEFDEMKKHPVLGYRLIEKSGVSKNVLLGVLMHHEKLDGTGYPTKIKGDQIHLYAKILAVADIYDAMTSNRCYKKKQSPFQVFELMENDAFGVLDPVVMGTFMKNIAAYYIGDKVVLNSGDVGEIMYINQWHISQPLVKVGETFIDLAVHTQYKINELV